DPGGVVGRPPLTECSGEEKRVSWRKPEASVPTEKSWQVPEGFVPNGSAEAAKSTRFPSGVRSGVVVSVRPKLVSCRRDFRWKKKISDIVSPASTLTGTPGTASRVALGWAGGGVVSKIGTTRRPATTGNGTRSRPDPSLFMTNSTWSRSGLSPSMSMNDKNEILPLLRNTGQQVPFCRSTSPTGWGGSKGRWVSCVRVPVAMSSVKIWIACSPPGPGPRSVTPTDAPFGLKDKGV